MKKLTAKGLSFIDKDSSPDIDWTKVEALYASVDWKRPFHKAAKLRRSFVNSYSFCIAVHDGELIGCGRTISDGQVHGWIHDVVVRPDFQGMGIGTIILQKLIGQLKGVRYLGLLCTEEASHFYQKSGFQKGWLAMTMRQKSGPGKRTS